MPNRTKSLLFDDDVVNAFAKKDMNFTIDEMLERYQKGEVSADITRRGISQCMAALVALDEKAGGWSIQHMTNMLAKVVKEYPALYAKD